MGIPAQQPPASLATVKRLVTASPVKLPEAYINLLMQSNGGEWPLSKQPFNLCLDTAEQVTAAIIAQDHSEGFSGFLIIGGDGGGEFIALDIRASEPWPVVTLDMTNIDIDKSRLQVSDNFEHFVKMIETEPGKA